MTRDQRNDRLLIQAGWFPLHFWEKDVLKDKADCIAEIEDAILAKLIEEAENATLQEFEEI